MFETHRAGDSVEDLVNAAATGDVGKVEQLLESGACGVDDKFDGKTALQAAAQNGHIDVVHVLIQYNTCLEEAVSFYPPCVVWATCCNLHAIKCARLVLGWLHCLKLWTSCVCGWGFLVHH